MELNRRNHILRNSVMNLEIIILIIATVVWITAEVYLVLRDNVQRKGKNYNRSKNKKLQFHFINSRNKLCSNY